MSTNADALNQDPEFAPSSMRTDQPQLGRWIGTVGFALALIGLDWVCWMFLDWSISRALYGAVNQGKTVIPFIPWIAAVPFFLGGLGMMLFHAAWEKDLQLRRVYGGFGALWLVVGILLTGLQSFSLMSPSALPFAVNLFAPGYGCLWVGLFFLLAFVRHETDPDWRQLTGFAIGGLGAAAALVGFLISTITVTFLVPNGVLLLLFGLTALWAFVYLRGETDELGTYATVGLVAGGAAFFLIALFRSVISPLFSRDWTYAWQAGILIMGFGLLYAGTYVVLRVETKLLAVLRRELGSFFCSPIAYAALLSSTVIAGVSFFFFLFPLGGFDPRNPEPVMPEPIIGAYLWGLFPILTAMALTPVLTMNTFSDERRTGTLEMMMTAPVEEVSVVLGKFLATLLFFMLAWVPWILLLVALYEMGGQRFDYRPVLSFLISLTCIGAGFVAVGNFFSSVTKQWYVAAMCTSGYMFLMLGTFVLVQPAQRTAALKPFASVLEHMSFIHLWENSVDGKLQPNYLLFHISVAVFFLFLTVKVLEARKWK